MQSSEDDGPKSGFDLYLELLNTSKYQNTVGFFSKTKTPNNDAIDDVVEKTYLNLIEQGNTPNEAVTNLEEGLKDQIISIQVDSKIGARARGSSIENLKEKYPQDFNNSDLNASLKNKKYKNR